MAKKKSKTKSKAKKGSKMKKNRGSLGVLIVTVAIIALVIIISKVKSGPAVKFLKSEKTAEWTSTADKKGQVNSPRGIAFSPDGAYLYVSMLNNNSVSKFKLPANPADNWTLAASWGAKGSKPGEFNEPSGVSTDKDGKVYVADAWNGRIQKFDANGKYETEIGGVKAGFYSPRNVMVNKYNIVYVADTGTSRIHRFDVEGNRVGNPAGGTGKSLGKFMEVFGLASDSKGRVYVSDEGNRRIEVFSSDLVPQAQIKVKAWDTNIPLWPMLAVDSADRLYAVSSGTQEIIVFDTKDKNFKYIGTIKNDMRDKPLFSNPLGIAIDAQDNLYVTDIAGNKVLKIKPVFE
ncbi:MAG: NHL repeat-containing protein [Candidatus Goldiibacteriota bacterium]|jgi:sugar lactone lactonase YvrE